VPDGDFLTIEEARRASAQEISRTLAPLPVPVLYIMGNDDLVELEGRAKIFKVATTRRNALFSLITVGW